MRVYLNLASCKEIFKVMTQVTKNIDEGRLKMKAHCPIVTDFGMKEKVIRILLCYNPLWLRIGLYIILGGESLLPNGDAESDQDIAFLKLVIERQFLSHEGLAKAYAYNKKVEGLYRPGYYESLGNVILKRFLLLVLALDRAKSQSSLPLKYGIDGLDGGSPLLFSLQSSIKSSSQMKLVVPADTMKKNVANCGIALQYLKQSGVPLKDEDGMTIEADDVACGDKELTLSLLWNMFLYLQAICNSYGLKIDNLDSLIDGKAIWCLLDYYFRTELHHSCPLKSQCHYFVGVPCMSFGYEEEYALEAANRFKAIQAWWQSMAEKDFKSISNPQNSALDVFPISKSENKPKRDDAACLIQSHYRGMIERRKFLKIMDAVSLLQSATRAWLVVRQKMLLPRSFVTEVDEFLCGRGKSSETYGRYLLLIFYRHNFVKLRRSVLLIQQAARKWISQKCQRKEMSSTILRTKAATQIQLAWRNVCLRNSLNYKCCAAIKIQSYVRGWFLRREYLNQKQAALTIQSNFQRLRCRRLKQRAEITLKSAIIIQCYARRWLCQRWYSRCYQLIVQIQTSSGYSQNSKIKIPLSSILRLQRWWRRVLLQRLRSKSAIFIQSYARGWIAKRKAARERDRVVLIQSYWKGYLTRKESRAQVVDLRLRVQKAAKNVDDNMRLINRLKAALSELLNIRSVTSILHTCATLDMATRHSQKCCEKLVEAGAIDKLLKLIRSMTRSIPDQEVLKHALSTLRNLARYAELLDVLIDSHGSIEIIFFELLRNKEDGFFIASELLKKICTRDKGAEGLRKSPSLLKRLNGLVEELTRRVHNDKRNGRVIAAKENTERRLKEAAQLLKLMVC
ncbi:hypothetical protein EUGRSUZ_D01308 [Eucalyptus grandis]|uniref:Uncharacterized protein n=2 Tax=Eucalyptus grandis TaxID=71139 RepID=A0ACC3L3V7_EUCGR|nr:hypothetical protein EUGRSUZ_D01308 [Eucalyptus grandis]